MQVYKFGGASIKNAAAIRQLKNIVSHADDSTLIVISAMGKTTNKLEEIVNLVFAEDSKYRDRIDELKNEFFEVVSDLFGNQKAHSVFTEVESYFDSIEDFCSNANGSGFDFAYDQIVSLGELISTQIVSAYLISAGQLNQWVDIRKLLITDDNFRDARINDQKSRLNCLKAFTFDETNLYVTQGFIASTESGDTTTLGREGSDYSAALLASYLKAKSICLWKDVNGIYNVDPARNPQAVLVPELSYLEMMELAWYGAKVIHPKAITPLQMNKIPLRVKSFIEPDNYGTRVSASSVSSKEIPYLVYREDQVLISISFKTLSFITEEHIRDLFALLGEYRISVNLMQHAAVSFSVCIDRPRSINVEHLIEILTRSYKVLYNDHVQLITIQNYTRADIPEIIQDKKILLEQRSRQTMQVIVGQ